ncbi:MAG: hypothetical protein ACFCD0_06935 [Gemmataceae bacterium]
MRLHIREERIPEMGKTQIKWDKRLFVALCVFTMGVNPVRGQQYQPQIPVVQPSSSTKQPDLTTHTLPPPPLVLTQTNVPEVIEDHRLPVQPSTFGSQPTTGPQSSSFEQGPAVGESVCPGECVPSQTGTRRRWFSGPLGRHLGGSEDKRAKLNRYGLGCHAHHDQFGCSSLWSEIRFAFGSCRAYFGEPCRPGPIRIPVPEGYVPPPDSPLLPYQGGGHQAYGYQGPNTDRYSAYRHPLDNRK